MDLAKVLSKYETPAQTAKRLSIDESRVRRLAKAGRIPGAVKLEEGRRGPWRIPKDAVPLQSNYGPKGTWG